MLPRQFSGGNVQTRTFASPPIKRHTASANIITNVVKSAASDITGTAIKFGGDISTGAVTVTHTIKGSAKIVGGDIQTGAVTISQGAQKVAKTVVNRVSSAGASVSKTLSNVGKTISGDVSGAAGTISKDVGGALGTLKKDVSGTIGNINNTGKVLNIYASILGFVTKYWYIIVAILSVVTLLIFYKLGVF